jgi:hypothetical protein
MKHNKKEEKSLIFGKIYKISIGLRKTKNHPISNCYNDRMLMIESIIIFEISFEECA